MSAKELFGVEKPIIALLHLRALPGDPAYNKAGGLNYIIDTAAAELRALQDGGVLLADALEQLERLGYNGTASVNITFRDCCLVPDRQIFLCGQWLKERGLLG